MKNQIVKGLLASLVLASSLGLASCGKKEDPTKEPTKEPTVETEEPTKEQTEVQTQEPTKEETLVPTPEPTPEVTPEPTPEPTPDVTPEPTPEAQKLATPENLKFDSDFLMFNEVANSDGYYVKVINEQEEVVLESDGEIVTVYDLSDFGKGKYHAEVMAYAPIGSTEFLDSEVATLDFEIASLGKLVAPENLRIEGGYINWDLNNARGYEIEVYKLGTDIVELIEEPVLDENGLMVSSLQLPDGDYTLKIKALSNRHDTNETVASTYDFTVKTVKKFNAEDIVKFNGQIAPNNWGGEHGKVEIVTVDGVEYAVVSPTADGWGRVASEQFLINFDKNPIVHFEMGTIKGGFHVQMTHDGTLYQVLTDTLAEGNIVRSLTGVKTEGGALLTATGIQTIALRLGVDNSTTTTANDARAYYKSVTVSYLTKYEEKSDVETKLATPEGLGINNQAQLAWNGVENANKYELVIKVRGTEEVKFNQQVEATSLHVYDLGSGDYTATLKAINTEDKLFLPSEAATFDFTVSEKMNHVGTDIANYVCGGGDNPAIQLNEKGNAVINPTGAAGWGWVWDQNGIDLNLDENPLLIARIESSNEGGSLARAKYDGHGDIVLQNDTPGAFSEAKTYVFRAKYNVDGNDQGSGLVKGFKFGMGVRGNGIIEISNIRIVTVTAYKAPVVEETKLATPTELTINNNGQLAWKSVENANQYNVKLTDSEGKIILNQKTDLASLVVTNLKASTYTAEIYALNSENPLFLNSDSATCKFEVEEVVSYKGADFTKFVVGASDANKGAYELDETTGLAILNPRGESGWGWFFPETGVTVDMDKHPYLVFDLASVSKGYLGRGQLGETTIVYANDTVVTLEDAIVSMRADVNVDGNPVATGVVENFKFGFGFIQNSINALREAKIVYVSLVK